MYKILSNKVWMKKTVLDFLFPPLCLHCRAFLEGEKTFCKGCSLFFELLDPSLRCFYCFSESEKRICTSCKKEGSTLASGAAFECIGAAETFLRKLKNEKLPDFVKLASSFLTVQFFRLNFPLPDYIVPIPSFYLSRFLEGKNHIHSLTKNLSRSLNIPMKEILRKNSFSSFSIKKKANIEGKKIMLIDDVLDMKKTENYREALLEGEPSSIYILSLCCK